MTSPSSVRGRAWSFVHATRWRAAALPLALAAPLLAATGYVAAVDPAEPGHYGTCPILAVTGLFCPGCGGLRAVHELTHGNLLGALDRNALVIALVVAVGAVWAWWLAARLRARPLRSRLVPVVLLALAVSIPVFTVVRNLPFGELLAP